MSKMNGSFKEDNLNLINKIGQNRFPSLKKEIVHDITRDRYYLYEKDSNKFFHSNSFGKKLFKISSDNLGKLTYEERLKKNLIEKVEIKKDNNLYHPRMKYFDGFTQIPRPKKLGTSDRVCRQPWKKKGRCDTIRVSCP